jgi:hypothetical protein
LFAALKLRHEQRDADEGIMEDPREIRPANVTILSGPYKKGNSLIGRPIGLQLIHSASLPDKTPQSGSSALEV